MKKKFLPTFILLLSIFILISPKSAHASYIDDFFKGLKESVSNSVDKVKDILNIKEDNNIKSKDFTVQSEVTLSPGGDINKNNQIDTGDIVRFKYVVSNNTDEDFTFATLNTHIQREKVHFIHNVSGVTGLKYEEGSIIFPNLRISARSQSTIQFDAQINYDVEDLDIYTEPEVLDSSKKRLIHSSKVSIKAKKLTNDEIKERLRKRSIVKSNSE